MNSMRKQILMIGAVLFGYTVLAGENLIQNSGFSDIQTEKGVAMPKFWYCSSWGKDSKKNASFMLIDKLYKSAPRTLEIMQNKGSNYCQVAQRVKIMRSTNNRTLHVSVWIRAEKINFGSLVVIADSPEKKALSLKRIAKFTGSFDWRKIEGEVEIPAKADVITVSIRLKGTGRIFADDCVAFFIKKKDKSNQSENLIINPELRGELNSGTGLPTGWKRNYVFGYENSSNVKVSNHPPTLRITWESGGARFGVSTQLKTKLKTNVYLLTAKLKNTDGSKGKLSVGEFETPTSTASGWHRISLKFKIRDGMKVNPIFWNIGNGTTEYKDFSLVKSQGIVEDKFPIEGIAMPVEINRTTLGKNIINSFVDNPVPIAFHFKSLHKFAPPGRFVIEMPCELKISEAFDSHPAQRRLERPKMSLFIKNTRKFRRYVFNNPKVFDILQQKYGWERKLVIAIEPDAPSLSNQSFNIKWYIENGAASGKSHTFTFHLLPAMPTVELPTEFPILCWGMNDINFISPEMINKIACNYEKAGIKYRPRRSGLDEVDSIFIKRGWKFYTNLVDYSNKRYSPKSSKESLKLAVYRNNKIPHHMLCPSFFNKNKQFHSEFITLLDNLTRKCKTADGEIICYDQEAWRPLDWCLCDECRKAFSQKYHLPKTPTAKDILEKYSSEWCEFRCGQTAKTLKIYTNFFKRKFPHCQILDYDYVVDYNNPGYKNLFRSVAKDPVMDEKYIDAHMASYYHLTDAKAFDMIKVNIATLKKPYYVIAAIDRLGYLSKKEMLSPERLSMLLFAAVIHGAKGFAIFPGMHIDGLTLSMLNRAMPVIAKLQHFVKKGSDASCGVRITPQHYVSKKIRVGNKTKVFNSPNWSNSFRSRVLRYENQKLIALFNYHPKRNIFVKLNIEMPSGAYSLINLKKGERVLPDAGEYWTSKTLGDVLVEISPVDIAFLLVRKYVPDDQKFPSTRSGIFKSRFNEIRRSMSNECVVFKPLAQGTLNLAADDVDGDGVLDVRLQSGDDLIWISPKYSAGVIKWRHGKIPLFGFNTKIPANQRILCADKFWLPKSSRGAVEDPYKLISATIVDSRAKVVFESDVKMGIQIRKTYSLSEGSDELTLNYSLKNIGPKVCDFAFWVHCFPVFDNNPTHENTVVKLSLTDGPSVINSGDGNLVFQVPGAPKNDFCEKFKMGTLSNGKITAFDSERKRGISIEFDFKQAAAVYLWRKVNPTMEWFYRQTALQTGKIWNTKVVLKPTP